MTTISAAMVKTLRDRTQAGMMDCKKFLEKAEGNLELAEELMRKELSLKASKKSDRIATEGWVLPFVKGNTAIIVEVNCETDFVGRSDDFKNFVKICAERCADGIDILSDASIDEARLALVSKLGENIQIRRFERLNANNTQFATYMHGQKIGVLVHLQGDETIGKDIAMHIAASKPEVIYPEDVSSALVEKEREIYMAQAANSGKPQNIIEKMVDGKIQKYLNEVSLVKQAFVKDPDTTVENYLKKGNAKILGFYRFEVGEGLEKKVDNFVEEVMAQVGRS